MGWGQSRQQHKFPDDKCTFLILGKTGTGKSSTGNMLLGKKIFDASGSLAGTTKQFERSGARFSNLELQVIDTPGFLDPSRNTATTSAIIGQGLLDLEPAPNIILYTISCRGRFTEDDEKVFELIKYLVGPDASTYMIIVFTGIDQMSEDIENDLAKRGNSAIQAKIAEVTNYAGCRYVTFDNTLSHKSKARDKQINNLLEIAKKIVAVNPRIKRSDTMKERINEVIQKYMSEASAPSDTNEKIEGKTSSKNYLRNILYEASRV